MRRILRLSMWVLLGMAAIPSYGQIDPDEVFTIFEWDFADGQGISPQDLNGMKWGIGGKNLQQSNLGNMMQKTDGWFQV